MTGWSGPVVKMRDISDLLDNWPYDGQESVRAFEGDDGREKVQIRVRIGSYNGILQFNCDDRPDGERPHDRAYALDYYQDEVRRRDGRYALGHDQAQELIDEAVMLYERYVVLLQLGDWDRVVRDTDRNMRLFRFVNRYAKDEEDRTQLEQWWPYIIRIHHTARAQKRLSNEDAEGALEEIEEALLNIGSLETMDNEVHEMERARSLKVLNELRHEIIGQLPEDDVLRLEAEKEEAIEAQDYERAAALRDRIRRLKG